ncbi:MAG: hypothetical protein KDC08_07905 [Actinobacteria bacterium]|nr:hypothetical protein [Actinomycetota bacterium]
MTAAADGAPVDLETECGTTPAVGRWPLVWVRLTIGVDVSIRVVILAALVVLVWSVWPGDGMLSLILIPAFGYAVWQAMVLPFIVQLLWRRWASVHGARRSVAVVACLGLPRLLWTIPIVVREGRGTAAYVAVAAGTVTVAVSALTMWVCLRPTQRSGA